MGRFLTPDPMGMVDGPNQYAFVTNNPVNFVDPDGHQSVPYMPGPQIIGPMIAPLPIMPAPILQPSMSLVMNKAGKERAGKSEEQNNNEKVNKSKSTTVIGSIKDTLKYLGRKGYNVLNIKNWTPTKNIKWLDKAIKKGDDFKMVTDPIKHQKLMQKLDKPSAFLDLEMPYLLEKGIIPK